MNEYLLRAASFAPDPFEENSAWLGHIPFAAYLVMAFKPTCFVELGTHYGHSYFAFCKAVQEHALSSRCYAVDTWQGDEHAGRYGEDVYNLVARQNTDSYAGFSTLLRMDFSQAVESFADGSIDLLHIDGLHTYEAVRSDFETWLPKLSSEAVVLFHDTNVRRDDFGVGSSGQSSRNAIRITLNFHILLVLACCSLACPRILSRSLAVYPRPRSCVTSRPSVSE